MVQIDCQEIEAALLTGGASRRMGRDKSELVVDGTPMAERIAAELAEHGLSVTVLGTKPIQGCHFVGDEAAYQGPLFALARFTPGCPLCFVASCDMPGFDASLIVSLKDRIEGFDAVIPMVDGRLQPLCALYASRSWTALRELALLGERRLMRWIDSLNIAVFEEPSFHAAGLRAENYANVNTEEEMNEFFQRRSARR